MRNLPCKKECEGLARAIDCIIGGFIKSLFWDVEAECRRGCEQCEK